MKKALTVILIAAIASVCLTAKAEQPMRYTHGDADSDGYLSIIDATCIQQWIAAFTLEQFDDFAADYNSSGHIEIMDATMIQRRLAGYSNQTVAYSYSQLNEYADAYLQEADYDAEDHSYSLMPPHIPTTRTASCRPTGYQLDIPVSGSLYLRDGDGNSITYNVEPGSFEVLNMTPGNEVTYLLTDNNGTRVKAGFLYPQGKVRMINGGGKTFNIRDLGGWDCDGGTLKYGLVFRGCELSGDNYNVNINEDQKSLFRDFLGIRDEIDMRSDQQVDGDDDVYGTDDDITESLFGDTVSYIRYIAAPYAPGIDPRNPYQRVYYAELIRRVSQDVASNKPCYIHCMAGADRTATLCAVIEAICGVSLSDIERDYELTSLSPEAARLRTSDEWKGLFDRLNSFPGDTLRDKAIYYALQIGVSIEEINALRAGLIDGDPESISAEQYQ